MTIAPGKKIYLTPDNQGVAEHLKAAFETHGIQGEIRPLATLVASDPPEDMAGMVIIVPGPEQHAHDTRALDFPAAEAAEEDTAFLKSAFLLARHCAPRLCEPGPGYGTLLATVSAMDGRLGFGNTPMGNPRSGGMAGLVKTAALEWDKVTCTALDLAPDTPITPQQARTMVRLMRSPTPVEAGVSGDHVAIPRLRETPISPAPCLEFVPEDLLVITGGARGVTARCALSLARQGAPAIVLLGRSPVPRPEPEWLTALTDDAAIKKALLSHHFTDQKPTPVELNRTFQSFMANREINQNMTAMETAGARVRYISVDIRDKDAVQGAMETVTKQLGPITGIIHGAGVVADRYIVDKTPEQFDQVFDTKIKGLDHLLSFCPVSGLRYLVFFSSVAARAGNMGQCDYAMANEVLNKSAAFLALTAPDCRIVSINWGPWEGGMVTPSLKREFEKRKIPLIPLEAGARALKDEMAVAERNGVEVVLGGLIAPVPAGTDPTVPERPISGPAVSPKPATMTVSTATCPVLASHIIGDEPVLPFALMVEWLAHAAGHAHPGLVFSGVDDMRVLAGIKPGKGALTVELLLDACTPMAGGISLGGTLTSSPASGKSRRHARGTLQLVEKLPPAPVPDRSRRVLLPDTDLDIEKLYEKVLFHGRALQSIQSITGYSDMGIAVTARRAPTPNKWLTPPHARHWVVDPLLLDSAFQAAIIWCHETCHMVCLPTCMASLRIYQGMSKGSGDVTIQFTVNERTDHAVKGYFTFQNVQGEIIAAITGFEAVMDPSLTAKFKERNTDEDHNARRPEHAAACPTPPPPAKISHGETSTYPPADTADTPLFSRDQILAFAVGRPSHAFGAPYAIFDRDREIARLPGPPYFFMDRVIGTDHTPWQLEPGGWIEAQFDLPADGWYFRAAATDTLPFCILLEIALQPCGWLAAYAGSALHSEKRLYFRNLGGEARLITPVRKESGTLTMRSRMTAVSKAGGLIIQDFDMEVLAGDTLVYQGHTNFGFFTEAALANQTGIKKSPLLPQASLADDTSRDVPATRKATATGEDKKKSTSTKSAASPDQRNKTSDTEKKEEGHKICFKDTAPLTPEDTNSDGPDIMPAKALRMVDEVKVLLSEGGKYGKGYIHAVKTVDPDEWFFAAHFYQDPVCPGSLGVESFLQVMAYFAYQKWALNPKTHRPVMVPHTHQWTYRGQIIPSACHVDLHVHIKEIDVDTKTITADGVLCVDGLCIYQMTDFVVALMPDHQA